VARGGRRKKKKLSERELRDQEIYGSLKSLLEELGWRVNLAGTLDGRGGHCIVRGERRVILKSQLPTNEKNDILIEALRGIDLDAVHVRPDLRELIAPGSLGEDETAGDAADELAHEAAPGVDAAEDSEPVAGS
jgi:hypothetical protein